MFYSFQENKIQKRSKSEKRRKIIKHIYGRKKMLNIKNFFLKKLDDSLYLEKENIKKKGISEKYPFYKLIEKKLEKYNIKKIEENNLYEFIYNVLMIINERNGKIFLITLNKIFEKKNEKKLILNFDKLNRKSLKKIKNRISFNILVFFFKREYDKFREKKISSEMFFEKIYYFLEEFLVLIKFECFEKGLFLENLLKTIFYKFENFSEKIKNFYNIQIKEEKSVLNKKIKNYEKIILLKNKKIKKLEKELNKRISEKENFIESKRKFDKKLADYNSILSDYRLKLKTASLMNFNVLKISKKIRFLSQNFQIENNDNYKVEIKSTLSEVQQRMKNLKKNFDKFTTLSNEDILINNEFMAFVELPKKKTFCNIGINAVNQKFDKSTFPIEVKKFDKIINCFPEVENKEIQCDLVDHFFHEKIKKQKTYFEEKIEKFENHLKEYFEVENQLLITSKASLISENSKYSKKINPKKSTNLTNYKLNMKKILKNIKRNVQVECNELFQQRKSIFPLNFRFDKNNSLNEDCHFIDKSLNFVKQLKNSKSFNLDKKLKKMILLLLKAILVENDNRDGLIILWDLFQKNNIGIFTNFKKFGAYLKTLINFKLYENKFGLCFYILNFENFNLSEMLKYLLKETFNCFNLQFYKK